MDNKAKKVRLNRSQAEIALSEEVFPNSAMNTISVTVFFDNFSAAETAAACDRVLESADIFSAALVKEKDGFFFYPRSGGSEKCSIGSRKTREQAEVYASELDAKPLDFPRELYRAEAFDLAEGGSALTVRFHHVITDGYGMSVFAQRVVDVLEKRDIQSSEFFGNNEAPPPIPKRIRRSGAIISRTANSSLPFSVRKPRGTGNQRFLLPFRRKFKARRDRSPNAVKYRCRMYTRRRIRYICAARRGNPTRFSLWRGLAELPSSGRSSAAIHW